MSDVPTDPQPVDPDEDPTVEPRDPQEEQPTQQ